MRIATRAPAGDVEVDDGVDVRQLWATVRERRGFVIGVALLLFIAVMAHTLNSSMTFRASGRLYLGELEMRARAASGSAAQVDISGGGQGDIGSEIEILKSQSLVTKAILDSGLNVRMEPVGWSAPRFWQWLLAKRQVEILDVAAREIRVVETALANDAKGVRSYEVLFTSPTEYRVLGADNTPIASGKLKRPTQVDGLLGLTLLPGTDGTPVPGARFRLTVEPLDAVIDGILGALTVTAASAPASGGEGAKVVMLEFTNSSPYAAATFLRELMRGYLGERQTWKTEDASAAETFVGEQLLSLRRALDTTQKRLAEYRSNTRVVLNENGANALVEQVGRYEEQRVQARLQVAAFQNMKRVLKQADPPTEAFLFGEAQDTVLEGLSRTLAGQRQEYDATSQQFGAGSPQAKQMRAKVDGQLEQIRSYVNSRLSRSQENLAELERVISQFDEKLRTVPGAEFGLAQLGRESEVYSRVYSYMLERQQQAAIVKASTVSKNRILDVPKVPYREDAPKLAMRAASLLLGLILGALMVILYRVFASSFQSEPEVRRVLGNVPVFARLPRREEGNGRTAIRGLDVFRGCNPAYAEAFRTLRTNIYLDIQSDVGKVILVTSPSPGDGKTASVLALAGILAADERRVCVIDADLRKPSHHDLIKRTNGLGLREILAGLARWEEVVAPVELSVGRFHSIGAGQKGPAEVLSGERMNRVLAELRREYDYIILDCASFPAVADPLVLTPLSDCVLSVFRLRNTPHKLATEHLRRLSDAAPSYGVVIQDTSQAGTVYPLKARPSIMASLLRRFDEFSNSGNGSARPSTLLLVALVSVLVAGTAAVVSRSRIAPPRAVSRLQEEAPPRPPAPARTANDLVIDPAAEPPVAAEPSVGADNLPVAPPAASEPSSARSPVAVDPQEAKRARPVARPQAAQVLGPRLQPAAPSPPPQGPLLPDNPY